MGPRLENPKNNERGAAELIIFRVFQPRMHYELKNDTANPLFLFYYLENIDLFRNFNLFAHIFEVVYF